MDKRPKRHLKYRAPLKALALLIGAGGLCLLLVGGFRWQSAGQQRRRLQSLNQNVTALNRQGLDNIDPQELTAIAGHAGRLGHPLPEADYARLNRQWRQAIEDFDRLKGALDNPYLKPRAKALMADFHQRLLQLRDAAAQSLESDLPPPLELRWKIHNLKGNASVLLAYSVLYYERDGRKAAKLLTDALEDYKTAIRQVDRVSQSSYERALPRWNLELIVGIGEYRRLGPTEIPQQDLAEVQEQLQAFIPEVPGFSPGVPLETRVEK